MPKINIQFAQDGTKLNPFGSDFNSSFESKRLAKLLAGFGSVPGASLEGATSGLSGVAGATGGLTSLLGNGLQKGLGSLLNFSTIANSPMNKTQKQISNIDAGVDTVSSFASMIPGIGGIAGGALGTLNKIGGALIGSPKIVKDYIKNDNITATGGYGGVAAKADDAANTADTYKSAGLFGKLFSKGKVKDQIGVANGMQKDVSKIITDNEMYKDRATSSANLFNTNNMNKIYGGNSWTNGSVQYGKNGTVINFKRLAKAARKSLVTIPEPKEEATEVIKSFQKGGALNVIVNGKLHAHRHKLKEIEGFEDAEITEKGVPVVTLSEGGEVVTQHAEVERDEIVLHKGLTKMLEALQETGDEDAMIEAGKLLAKELVKNTRDSENKILKNA